MQDEQLEQVLDQIEPNHETVEDVVTAQASGNEEESQKADNAARNFAALREAKERLERENAEALRYIQQMHERYNQPAQQEPEDEEDADFNIADEDLVEARYLKALQKQNLKTKKEMRQLKKEMEEQNRKNTEITTEMMLKSKFPDFDAVVNSSNIAKLREQYPELAATINDSKSLYNRGASAYLMIKQMAGSGYQEDNESLARKNTSKPKPINSISSKSLQDASAYYRDTPEERKKLYNEMIEAMRNK